MEGIGELDEHSIKMAFAKSFAKFFACALASGSALAASVGPAPGQIKNLVTFGDSYTDVVSLIIAVQYTCTR